jgi:hypothetical protein
MKKVNGGWRALRIWRGGVECGLGRERRSGENEEERHTNGSRTPRCIRSRRRTPPSSKKVFGCIKLSSSLILGWESRSVAGRHGGE